MATLEQRGRSYRVIFFLDGARFTRSLRTKNIRQAELMRLRVEDNLRRLQLGTLAIPDGADVATCLLSDGHVPVRDVPKPRPTLTLARAFDEFFESIPDNAMEANSLVVLKVHANHLRRTLGSSLSLQELESDHLQRYIVKRTQGHSHLGKPVQPVTIRKEIMTLRTLWNWAIETKRIQGAFPRSGYRFAKTEEKPPFRTFDQIQRQLARGGFDTMQERSLWDCMFLTLPEIADVLDCVRKNAPYPYLYPMVLFAAHTGARRSELIRSRIHDIDWTDQSATIREKKRVRGKLTTRRVPLSPQLANVVGDWLADHPGGDHTFTMGMSVIRGKLARIVPLPLRPADVHRHLKAALAGSQWNVIRGWHIFRHSFCSNCAAQGIDQRLINAWVGHQTEEMVQRYRHVIPHKENDAIRAVFGSTVGVRSDTSLELVHA